MTAHSDKGSYLTNADLIPVQNCTALLNGSAFDVTQGKGLASVVVSFEAGAGTSRTMDIVIEDSDDGSTGWAPVYAFPQVSAFPAQVSTAVNLDAVRRYVRMTLTPTNVTRMWSHALMRYATS